MVAVGYRMPSTFLRVTPAAGLAAALLLLPACDRGRAPDPTGSASTMPPPAAPTDPALGTWTVVGFRMPGISAMSEADAQAWKGRTVVLTAMRATSGTDSCSTPQYETRTVPTDSLLEVDFRTTAAALGLSPGGTMDVTQVSCAGSPWAAPGSILLHSGPTRAFTTWDGVFFELERRASDTASLLDATGFGPYRVGITLAAFNAALGEHLVPAYQANPTCDFVKPAGFPDGIMAMVEHDTVVRFDVENPAIRTLAGAGVGDPEAEVVARYGASLTVTPHKYTGPEGHYLVVRPPGDTLHQVIFETDGKVVTHVRVGRLPAVAFVEGCA